MTLIELLVVIAIIGVLTGLLLPAVQAVREASRRMTCGAHLQEIGLAMHNHLSNRGGFPPGRVNIGKPDFEASWQTLLLPYLEQTPLREKYQTKLKWSNETNYPITSTQLEIFRCPSAPDTRTVPGMLLLQERDIDYPVTGFGYNDYSAINTIRRSCWVSQGFELPGGPMRALPGALWPTDHKAPELINRWIRPSEIQDGLSSTYMIVESAGRPEMYVNGRLTPNPDPGEVWSDTLSVKEGWGWADIQDSFSLDFASEETGRSNRTNKNFPFDVELRGSKAINATNDGEIYSFHPGGVMTLRCDGSVGFVTDSLDPMLLVRLATKAGREVVDGPTP